MSTPHIQTRLLIIGAGPGGYVAAIRAAQLGIATTLVEARAPGGTCLNIGCIPSKALIHAAGEFAKAQACAAGASPLGIHASGITLDIAQTIAWKDGIVQRLTGGVAALLKKHKVQLVHGWAHIVDGKTVEVRDASGTATQRIGCEHLLLATGSQPMALPALPFDGQTVISSTEALSPRQVPDRLIVVGAGYIGLELGIAYRQLGAQVTVVEAAERILPAYDAELTQPVQRRLEQRGIRLYLQHQVIGAAPASSAGGAAGVVIRPAGNATAEALTLQADQVLVAVGRQPRTAGYGLEDLPIERHGRAVRVDDQCRTSMRQVWAIGDLTGEPMLAHRAMAQGEMVAEIIAGHRRHFQPAAMAAICFTEPELVSAGLSPDQAQAAGHDVLSAQFPLAANGRAMTLEGTEGFVRVVARRSDHRILGWQAVGGHVAELAAAFAQSLEMGAHLEDVAHTIHAHPTLGEAIQEAALRALGQALHV
ncbi:dihydrolipoyl dehydrogenase [Corticibacter populi]|uniref:Dihydrolipoyl dehydrogenase n=1 Tax=Corticibacter populi TaxID=1550736 RepID=A0A3M6QHS9_9BURK|nr:dihydrolipoyl dehydrogenase [Corticibacter populi]RMX02617.1 dihydrolipoyl dehydrogenase [Corticibacter populi]RZS32969.1 dihydrolipoamide dehydrogenase [Corticibacter populi]